jgi:hypothetical protein
MPASAPARPLKSAPIATNPRQHPTANSISCKL